jgi:hypothetical protein
MNCRNNIFGLGKIMGNNFEIIVWCQMIAQMDKDASTICNNIGIRYIQELASPIIIKVVRRFNE